MIMIFPLHPAGSELINPSANSTLHSQGAAEGIAECKQAVRREQRQHNRHGLPEPDRPGERRPAQDDGREETQLDAVGRAGVDTVAAEAVWCRDMGSAEMLLLPRAQSRMARKSKQR